MGVRLGRVGRPSRSFVLPCTDPKQLRPIMLGPARAASIHCLSASLVCSARFGLAKSRRLKAPRGQR